MTASLDLAPRLAALLPSATLAIAARAKQLQAQGRDVLDLSAGEPDCPPPRAVREEMSRRAASERLGYTPVPGLPELRAAVADELGAYHGRPTTPEDVLVSCGAKHSLMNLFLATLGPGDRVVVPSPYWVSYPDMVRMAGAEPVVARTHLDDGWRLRPEELERHLDERTRFVIVNSPNNPTGAGYRREDLRALGEVLVRRAPQAWIVCDDIYRRLVYDGFQHVSVVRALEGLTDRVVVVDGLSKSHAMMGYRIGFLLAPAPVIRAATIVQGQVTSGAATLSQWGALVALRDPTCAADLAQMQASFSRRRDLVLAEVATIPQLRLRPPDGAFYAFCDASRVCGPGTRFPDDVALARWLLEERLVATVPGTAFGAPGHLRMSYATGDDVLRGAFGRLREALASLGA